MPPEVEPIYQVFKKIISKDHQVSIGGQDLPAKSASEALTEFIALYVKTHSDNPAPTLDKFQDPDYVAFPTLGEAPKAEAIKKMDDKMLKRLRLVAQNYALMAEKEEELRGLV